MTLKICVAQLNLIAGDLAGNAQKIIQAARQAHQDGAQLVLTPELSICGYACEDLFLRAAFIDACDAAVGSVAQALAPLTDLTVVVGHPSGGDWRTKSVAVSQRYNAASVLRAGQTVAHYAKRELPNYQVFDERRYFTPGHQVCVFEAGTAKHSVKVGLLICEDAWFEAPAQQTRAAGAQLLAVLNASPFHVGKSQERQHIMRQRVLDCGAPLIYAHLVGGQDEMVFEGRSFALNADGTLAAQAPAFVESNLLLELKPNGQQFSSQCSSATEREAERDLWDALVLGLRDYINKNRFTSVLLGLSGGIDSALVLAIAVDALGPDRVRALMMPSNYTADISLLDAQNLAKNLGVRYDELSIKPAVEAFEATLASEFAGLKSDSTEENIQARVRGVLLMALSNKFGSIVLTTGNKSEIATGYCTLYGDMAGGFAVIKDLTKTTVYRLAHWRNQNDPYGCGAAPIPERIISRAPSAELRPDQTDQDSLPPYEVLDAILQRYMEDDQSSQDIIKAGFARADVELVTKLIKNNEYKRRQAPPGIRVTHRSFGKDWRYPITNGFPA